ncbi:MAG TPA: L-seryl-tRNA(Sec) selenium transferase [Verrucomicrobiae bacterium]|nr:L-seryl-tRNA(Sec) selenium transferase [Verrucomicrobiae bacterium]
MSTKADLFRELPSVDELLRRDGVRSLAHQFGHAETVEAARKFIEELRGRIAADSLDEAALASSVEDAAAAIERRLQESLSYSLRPVINATGVILHTNLGRAPLGEAALQHVMEVARGYSNVEFDLATGERGKRDVHVSRLFAKLLNCPGRELSTIVVNNNAAAVLLTLNALAEGGEVIVSRGELVEIGGSFRIPDVMAKSGAVLKEVGTTNRTRIADYESAISDRTKLLLRVHRSNFQIVGFTEQPSLAELAALGRKHNIPVVEDLGSGELFDLREVGVHGEPMISESLRAGVAVVTYSGDKLLGGPQAGLISGDGELVAKIRKNPLFRALRVDKIFYAALEATLLAYLREDFDAIPTLRMMRVNAEDLQHRAEHIVRHLRMSSPQVEIEVAETRSAIGGGSAPGATLPSWAVTVKIAGQSAEKILERLRKCETPIVARVEDGRVLLDLRTVEAEQDGLITAAVESLCEGGNAGPSSG